MDESFVRQWFGGFSQGLDQMTEEERGKILAPCAKACAESYPLGKFREAKDKANSLSSFALHVEEALPGVKAVADDATHRIVINYPQCYCDLYVQKLVTTPKLCECSRQNLLYIMGELFPEQQVDVRLVKSVIAGDDVCELSAAFSGDVFA